MFLAPCLTSSPRQLWTWTLHPPAKLCFSLRATQVKSYQVPLSCDIWLSLQLHAVWRSGRVDVCLVKYEDISLAVLLCSILRLARWYIHILLKAPSPWKFKLFEGTLYFPRIECLRGPENLRIGEEKSKTEIMIKTMTCVPLIFFTINRECYSQLLQTVKTACRNKWRGMFTRDVILLYDNARPQVAYLDYR